MEKEERKPISIMSREDLKLTPETKTDVAILLENSTKKQGENAQIPFLTSADVKQNNETDFTILMHNIANQMQNVDFHNYPTSAVEYNMQKILEAMYQNNRLTIQRKRYAIGTNMTKEYEEVEYNGNRYVREIAESDEDLKNYSIYIGYIMGFVQDEERRKKIEEIFGRELLNQDNEKLKQQIASSDYYDEHFLTIVKHYANGEPIWFVVEPITREKAKETRR